MRHKPRKSAPTADAAWSLAQAWGPALDKIVFLGDFHLLVLLAYFGCYEDHECRAALCAPVLLHEAVRFAAARMTLSGRRWLFRFLSPNALWRENLERNNPLFD